MNHKTVETSKLALLCKTAAHVVTPISPGNVPEMTAHVATRQHKPQQSGEDLHDGEDL